MCRFFSLNALIIYVTELSPTKVTGDVGWSSSIGMGVLCLLNLNEISEVVLWKNELMTNLHHHNASMSYPGNAYDLVLILVLFFLFHFAVAYLNLGTSLIALGRCQEAASVLREGSKLDGVGLRDRAAHDNARISALLQLGNLYADQGKLQRALAVYREALHILPDRYPPQVSSVPSYPPILLDLLPV